MELEYDDLVRIRNGIDENNTEVWNDLFLFVNERLSKYLVKRVKNIHDREDLKQEIELKIFKNIQIGFFSNSRNGNDNLQPENFYRWMYTIAKHTLCDYYKTTEKKNQQEIDLIFTNDDGEGGDLHKEQFLDNFCSIEQQCFLTDETELFFKMYNETVHMKAPTYKVLSWMIYGLYIIVLGKKAASFVEAHCESMELFDILDHFMKMMVVYTDALSDNHIAEEKKELIEEWYNLLLKRLSEEEFDGQAIGNCVYSTFFMKKGGKASVSDWVNRINAKLRKCEQNGG